MKTAFFSFFCLLLVFGCKPIQDVEPQPVPLEFKTTCLLSKKQRFDEQLNGSMKLINEDIYKYDSLKRIIEKTEFWDVGNNLIRFDFSYKNTYKYNSQGFLTEILREGKSYNGYAKNYALNLSPHGTSSGYTTFTYQNGLLVKQYSYLKLSVEYAVEGANPAINQSNYEYDSNGNLKKPTDTATQKYNKWGQLSQAGLPKKYFNNGSLLLNVNEMGDYNTYFYDGYGRIIKADGYEQLFNYEHTNISTNATFVGTKACKYEDTPTPETTLPLPKGHPKIPNWGVINTFNINSDIKSVASPLIGKYLIKKDETFYSYTYNNEKLPVNQVVTGNSFDKKGIATAKYKTVYKYEYINCK